MKTPLFAAVLIAAGSLHIAAGEESPDPVQPVQPVSRLAVDGPVVGFCHVGTDVRDTSALGGFWASGNGSKAIPRDMKVEKGAVQLVVAPSESVENVNCAGQTCTGIALRLINAANKPLKLTAQDSRISIVQEAKDADGVWRPITTLPGSFCGNSYHQVTLKAGRYWEFAAPLYEGEFETELRFRLGDVVSNVYRDRIDPGQFADGKAAAEG